MAVVVARGFIAGALRLAQGFQFGFGAVAAIGFATVEQLLHGGFVEVEPLGLVERAFVPVQAQPLEAGQDVVGVFRSRSLEVCIFDAQDELALMPPRKQPVEDGSAGRANVEVAGGARSNANAN